MKTSMQGYKNKGIQGYVQGYKDTGIQGYKDTRIQGYTNQGKLCSVWKELFHEGRM